MRLGQKFSHDLPDAPAAIKQGRTTVFKDSCSGVAPMLRINVSLSIGELDLPRTACNGCEVLNVQNDRERAYLILNKW